LRDYGNIIFVIEHNLDVIKTADLVLDMCPEGVEVGGYIIAADTPEVANTNGSHTGYFLKKILMQI